MNDLQGRLRDAIAASVEGAEPSFDLMTAVRRRHRRRLRRLAVTGPVAVMVVIATTVLVAASYAQPGRHMPGAAANGDTTLNGSGSSWGAFPVDLWAQDLRTSHLVVNYNADGSAAGRADYEANQADFAVSEPPFRSTKDKLGGVGPEHPLQGYSYVPYAAGASAFPYHLSVNGHLITSLRLSPGALALIFTGVITNWDSPWITKNNHGVRLPSLPITVVVHTEGDGGTYLFTRWLARKYPRLWNTFCDRVRPGLAAPCGPTEFYPVFGHAMGENGSTNVISYIASRSGNGAIGYDEFAYALNAHIPVIRLGNPAGRYVLPTAANVTTALSQAIINANPGSRNFLQQNLNGVYAYANPLSYPLASYSYLIVPREGTRLPTNFTRAKGRALSAFIAYGLCQGQRQLVSLGYAPLPRALVREALKQVGQIPGHGRVPSLSRCR